MFNKLAARTSTFVRLAQIQQCNRALIAPASRMVHARGYNNMEDRVAYVFHEVNMALMNCKNTENMGEIYTKYGEYMTDKQIMYGFHFIATNKIDKAPAFWDVILPMVKKQLEGLDRETTPSLFMAVEGAAAMYLQDNEFWEIVENKFVDEGLWRYFTLETTAEFLCSIARVGRGSDEIVDLIEKHFIKHRKGLTPETIAIAKLGFARLNKGSEILHRVLADPKTELPALE